MFLERGAPIPIQDIVPQDALAALDADDLIRIRNGLIDIAYPFSAAPTPFRVRFSAGRERYACCATDALGMAPMVGEHVEIMSQCHHCAAPIGFSATPQGPRHDADGVMVWFGKRADDRCKAIDGL